MANCLSFPPSSSLVRPPPPISRLQPGPASRARESYASLLNNYSNNLQHLTGPFRKFRDITSAALSSLPLPPSRVSHPSPSFSSFLAFSPPTPLSIAHAQRAARSGPVAPAAALSRHRAPPPNLIPSAIPKSNQTKLTLT